MNPEFKAKWVSALMSGQYKQGRGVLRSKTDRFCCLGVACDLIDKDSWGDLDGKAYPLINGAQMDPLSFIGPKQRELMDITIDEALTLAEMNDAGKKFTTIAKFIEKNL